MGEAQQPVLKRLYPLTSLQIGDLQSYVSRLYLYLPEKGLQLVFIVDNGPWTTKRRRSMPAELWQAMVTKSRVSPFANGRLKLAEEQRSFRSARAPELRGPIESSSSRVGTWNFGWGPLLNTLQRSCKDMINVQKPSQLYGCVSFEVAWADVRGINYVNELQTDTCVSLEVKYMRKREFDSLKQAEAWYASPLSCCQNGQAGRDVLHVGSLAVGVQDYTGQEIWSRRSLSDDYASTSNSHGFVAATSSETGDANEGDGPGHSASSARSSITSETGAGSNAGAWSWFRKLDMETEDRIEFVTPPSSPSGIGTPPSQLDQPGGWSSEGSGSGLKHRKRKPAYVGERSSKSRDRLNGFSGYTAARMKELVESESKLDAPAPCQRVSWSSSMSDTAAPDLFRDCEMSSGLACRTPEMEGYCPRRDILGDKIFSKQFTCGTAESREQFLYTHLARFISPAAFYKDSFISFRFADPILPFDLEQIITADQRLLKMLESGLPSWVIFLQSYPIVSHIYRPWMRPLASTVYFLVSVVTVLIGFYDLYKNVPVLKATARHIFGPLAEWIDSWEMVSRLKYLGTMLFLQNFEKAFSWIVISLGAARQLSALALRPVAEPLMHIAEFLLPVWTAVMDVIVAVGMLMWSLFSTVYMLFSGLLGTLTWPIFVFLQAIWSLGVTLLYPIFSAVWGLLTLPIQLLMSLVNLIAVLASGLIEVLLNAWMAVSSTFKLVVTSGAPAVTSIRAAKSMSPAVPSLWRTLWNDIFSKVFRAVKSIVQGLAAFSASCNRHRLSMYNNIVAFLCRMTCLFHSGRGAAQSAYRQIFYHQIDPESTSSSLSDMEYDPTTEDGEQYPEPSEQGLEDEQDAVQQHEEYNMNPGEELDQESELKQDEIVTQEEEAAPEAADPESEISLA